jgi:hypothetical protein
MEIIALLFCMKVVVTVILPAMASADRCAAPVYPRSPLRGQGATEVIDGEHIRNPGAEVNLALPRRMMFPRRI